MISMYLWLTVLIFAWLYFLWTRRKFYLLMLKIPGPSGYPLIGMAHKLLQREDVLKTFNDNIQKYGSVLFSWLGPLPFLVVSEPQIAQDILTSPHCINKGIIYAAIDDGTGPGLFSLNDPDWSAHRKLLNPAFGHKVLLSFMPIFNDEVAILMKDLNDSVIDKGEKDLIPLLQKFTLGIATQTTMGGSVKHEKHFQNNTLLECYQCTLETMTNMCFSPWLINKAVRRLLGKDVEYSRAKREIRGFIRKLITQKLESDVEVAPDAKDKNTFLNLATDLLKKGIFSWQNVEYESNVIVFGAFETTANTIAYSLMLLAMFPDCQEKAFEEMKILFPNAGDFEVTFADTQNMVYLDLILNETMRLMAPVPVVSRKTSEDVKLSNGIVVPRGVQIAIDIFHMHRNKKIWGADAESFNPDHFLPSNKQGKHPYAFIPFTKGIRNCIGWRYALLSAKVTLAKLIRNYYFSTSFDFKDLQFVEDITIKLKHTPHLELRSRGLHECALNGIQIIHSQNAQSNNIRTTFERKGTKSNERD